MTLLILLVYSTLIAGASLAGGWLPVWLRLTHVRMQLVMSLVAGLMLGVALLHLLPHAATRLKDLDTAIQATLLGLVGMFFLIRIFHVHQHAPTEETLVSEASAHAASDSAHAREDRGGEQAGLEPPAAGADHGQGHVRAEGEDASGHDHRHCEHHLGGHVEHDCPTHRNAFSWIGLALGLGLHTLIDGMALGASVLAEDPLVTHDHGWYLGGLATFLAILLHKPLDAVSITSVMASSGWTPRSVGMVNGFFALLCPLGAIAFVLGLKTLDGEQVSWVVGSALGIAAGVFLCIALADILPEVRFHSHDRIKLSLALVFGIALAYLIGQLEPEHVHHGHAHEGAPQGAQQEHPEHEHPEQEHPGHEHAGHDH